MTGCHHDEKGRVSGGEGSGKCILSQSAACPAGGLSYKPEIASYSQSLSYSSQNSIHWPSCTGSAGHRFRPPSELLPRGVGVPKVSDGAGPGQNEGSGGAELPGGDSGGLSCPSLGQHLLPLGQACPWQPLGVPELPGQECPGTGPVPCPLGWAREAAGM